MSGTYLTERERSIQRAEDFEQRAAALEGAGFPIQARSYRQRAGIIRALMEED